MKHALFFAVALLAAVSPARAQSDDPLDAERPGFTAGVSIVKRPQYELGITRYRNGGSRTVFNDGGLLRLPTKGKTLEVRLGVPSREGSSWGDPSIGAKWGFTDGAALIVTGAKNARPQYALELERALSPLWALQTDFVRTPDGESAGALNVGYGVTKTLGLFIESYAQADGRWLDGGATLLSGKNVQLDFNIGIGLQRSNRKQNFVGLGLVRRW